MKAILNLWIGLTPWTKRIIIIVLGLVLITLIICAAMTGELDNLIGVLGGKE